MKVVEIFMEDHTKLRKIGTSGYQPGQAQARTSINKVNPHGSCVAEIHGSAAKEVFHILNLDVSKVNLPAQVSIHIEGDRPLMTIYYEVANEPYGPLAPCSFDVDRDYRKDYPSYGVLLKRIGEIQRDERVFHVTVSSRVSSETSVTAAKKIIEIINRYA